MFYATVDGLRWVDAVYLSVVTLTTLGYGDLHPVSDLGKLFTIFYLFTGMGVVITVVIRLARAMFNEPASKQEDPLRCSALALWAARRLAAATPSATARIIRLSRWGRRAVHPPQ